MPIAAALKADLNAGSESKSRSMRDSRERGGRRDDLEVSAGCWQGQKSALRLTPWKRAMGTHQITEKECSVQGLRSEIEGENLAPVLRCANDSVDD